MNAFISHPFIEWLIMVLAIMAGFLLIKFLISFLPDVNFLGAMKNLVMAA